MRTAGRLGLPVDNPKVMNCNLVPIEFRQASAQDAATVYSLLKACGEWMKETLGLGHWTPPYSESRILADIHKNRVFLATIDGVAVGTFSVSSNRPATWAEAPEADALYLGKLAVLPQRTGGGIGGRCFGEAVRLAREAGRARLRLDVYDQSQHAIAFFSGMGCKTVGKARTRRFTVLLMEMETY